MRAAIDALETAFGEEDPAAAGPPRSSVQTRAGSLLLMPATGDRGVGVKLVTISEGNPAIGAPLIQAVLRPVRSGDPDARGGARRHRAHGDPDGGGERPGDEAPREPGREPARALRRRHAGHLAPRGDDGRPSGRGGRRRLPDGRARRAARRACRVDGAAGVDRRARGRGGRRPGLHVHDVVHTGVRRGAARGRGARERGRRLPARGSRAGYRGRSLAGGSSWRRARSRWPRPETCSCRSPRARSDRSTSWPISRRSFAGARSGPSETTSRVFVSVGMAFEDLVVARAAIEALG